VHFAAPRLGAVEVAGVACTVPDPRQDAGPRTAIDRQVVHSSGSKLSLCLGKSEFLEFDSLSENPFDPLVHTGLAVQAGQESCARR